METNAEFNHHLNDLRAESHVTRPTEEELSARPKVVAPCVEAGRRGGEGCERSGEQGGRAKAGLQQRTAGRGKRRIRLFHAASLPAPQARSKSQDAAAMESSVTKPCCRVLSQSLGDPRSPAPEPVARPPLDLCMTPAYNKNT